MTTGTEAESEGSSSTVPSLIDALLVYAEPLAAEAHAVVLGDAEGPVADRLLELGARSVHVFDPDPARAANAARKAPRGVTVRALVDDLDVRDGAFDVAIVPDLSELNDPGEIVARLRRAVARNGAVVAMGRAKLADLGEAGPSIVPFPSELGPATLEYAELYDLFAVVFEDVSLAGVVPFEGVVFAELGRDDDEASAVSVDTRFAPSSPPSIFAVVARTHQTTARPLHAREPLDPYAIVQIAARQKPAPPRAIEAEVVEMRLKAELLGAQLEETRDRLLVADALQAEANARLDRAVTERDGALTRAMELEAVLAASQQTMGTLERRLLEAEQGMLERDDRIAALGASRDSRRSEELALEEALASEVVNVADLLTRAERAEAALAIAVEELAARAAAACEAEEAAAAMAHLNANLIELRDRAERAEAALALSVVDLKHVSESHVHETASYEEQLQGRARLVAGLEKELVRREQLVKQLVASLEAARESGSANQGGVVFEAAAPLSVPSPDRPDPALAEENARLRAKLDELASDIARREGELQARAWRITELENRIPQANREEEEREVVETTGGSASASAELARARDELDALRQALAQEHSARMAVESGEELAHARSELARQSALLEQMRGRLETS